MSIALITGSAGLVGSEASRYFAGVGYEIVGIDNDLRSTFFGPDASVSWQRNNLKKTLAKKYRHYELDVRDVSSVNGTFSKYNHDISLVIHTAAQPSHDWAAKDPQCDFSVNASGTLNILEATRLYCPGAVFIFASTNKVYGDRPNALPLVELERRWEIDSSHPYSGGIPENMSIDGCLHSLFGVSKAAADLMVQEYGRYFGLKTACFRGGCLSGPNHSGAELHGFLAYLMKCAVKGIPYRVYGYKGKQVRDNIHSHDLLRAFDEFRKAPGVGECFNIGGGRASNCSMLEAITLCEEIVDRPMNWTYVEEPRVGDHIWWISDISKFRNRYVNWDITRDIRWILTDIFESNKHRWLAENVP
jgi:CDP-paratose 2-epimerase